MIVGANGFFSSDRLLNESGYSHAFGAPGEYSWVDAHGSPIAGVVRVKDPGCKDRVGFQRWYESLAKGTLVMISEQGAKPSEVEIVTGQTVFFSIITSPGISITDRRLLAHAEPPKAPAKWQRAAARPAK